MADNAGATVASTALGAALPGFGALLGPALFSLIPGLAGLFGGDPQKKLRQQAQKIIGQEGAFRNRFYQENLSSPAYQQALATIAAGANQAGGQIANELGSRGIGTTGTGAVLSGLVPSMVGQQRGQLQTSAYQQAGQQAQEQIRRQLELLMGTQGPSPAQAGFAGGLNAFAPFLQQFLTARYPGTFGPTQKA